MAELRQTSERQQTRLEWQNGLLKDSITAIEADWDELIKSYEDRVQKLRKELEVEREKNEVYLSRIQESTG